MNGWPHVKASTVVGEEEDLEGQPRLARAEVGRICQIALPRSSFIIVIGHPEER